MKRPINQPLNKGQLKSQMNMFLFFRQKLLGVPLSCPNPLSLILTTPLPPGCAVRSGVLLHNGLFNLRGRHVKHIQLYQETMLLTLGIKIMLWSSFSDQCMLIFVYFTLMYISRFINKYRFFSLIFQEMTISNKAWRNFPKTLPQHCTCSISCIC